MTELMARAKTVAESELTKLVTHMESSDPDPRDIRMLKDLLEIVYYSSIIKA